MYERLGHQAQIYVGTEAIYGVAMGMYSFVLNLFFLSLGIETVKIGMITSVGIVVMSICALPLGFLAGKTGRKNMYAGGVLLIGINIVLYVFCPMHFLVIPVVLVAVGMTMVEVSEVQVMYQCCQSDRERVTVFSISFAAFSLSSALGVFMAGRLPGMIGYRGTLLTAGCLTLVVGIMRWCLISDDRKSKTEEKTTHRHGKISLNRILDRRFLAFLLVIALHGALSNTIGPFSNLIVKYRSGWGDERVSAVLTLALMVNFFFALYTPKLQRKLYHAKSYLIVYIVLIIVLLTLAGNIGTFPFILLFLIRGGVEIMLKNMLDSVAYVTLDEEQKDIYSGARSLVKGATGALTALWVGVLLENMKIYAVFLTASGLMITALILFLCLIAPLFQNKSE